MRRTSTVVALATTAAVLAVPAAAGAHVTINPREAAAGSFSVLAVRVPNERDRAGTVKLSLRFPAGVPSVSYEPVSGWTTRVVMRRLSKPIETENGRITRVVSRVMWTGTRRGLGRIAPGQFRDFRISVRVPGDAGDVHTFKALQTYSNGEQVHWYGKPDAELPAPTLTVTAPAAEPHGLAAGLLTTF